MWEYKYDFCLEMVGKRKSPREREKFPAAKEFRLPPHAHRRPQRKWNVGTLKTYSTKINLTVISSVLLKKWFILFVLARIPLNGAA